MVIYILQVNKSALRYNVSNQVAGKFIFAQHPVLLHELSVSDEDVIEVWDAADWEWIKWLVSLAIPVALKAQLLICCVGLQDDEYNGLDDMLSTISDLHK